MTITGKRFSWYTYYNSGSVISTQQIIAKVLNGEDIWVRFRDPKESRCGSIGKLARFVDPARPINWSIRRNFTTNDVSYGTEMQVDFPGLKNASIKIIAYAFEDKLELIENYTGPAVRLNNKIEKPKPVTATVDMFGHDTKIGDLIAFTHYGNLKFGNILKIHPSGAMQIKTMPDNYEVRASAGFPFAVIHGNFSQSLMLVKLTHTG